MAIFNWTISKNDTMYVEANLRLHIEQKRQKMNIACSWKAARLKMERHKIWYKNMNVSVVPLNARVHWVINEVINCTASHIFHFFI